MINGRIFFTRASFVSSRLASERYSAYSRYLPGVSAVNFFAAVLLFSNASPSSDGISNFFAREGAICLPSSTVGFVCAHANDVFAFVRVARHAPLNFFCERGGAKNFPPLTQLSLPIVSLGYVVVDRSCALYKVIVTSDYRLIDENQL